MKLLLAMICLIGPSYSTQHPIQGIMTYDRRTGGTTAVMKMIVDDNFLVKFSEQLMDNKTTDRIGMMNQRITNRGAISLAAVLSTNTTVLEIVDLSGNQIGDKGAHELAMALVTNPVIKIVDLTRNNISQEMIEKIDMCIDFRQRIKLDRIVEPKITIEFKSSSKTS